MTQWLKNKTLLTFSVLSVSTVAASSLAVADQSRKHPNIVFIMADDK